MNTSKLKKCARCGKLTDEIFPHTCTPKALLLAQALHDRKDVYEDAADELRRLHAMTERRLTDEVIADLWHRNGTYHHHFARAIERWLKGQE